MYTASRKTLPHLAHWRHESLGIQSPRQNYHDHMFHTPCVPSRLVVCQSAFGARHGCVSPHSYTPSISGVSMSRCLNRQRCRSHFSNSCTSHVSCATNLPFSVDRFVESLPGMIPRSFYVREAFTSTRWSVQRQVTVVGACYGRERFRFAHLFVAAVDAPGQKRPTWT